jgi:hypothetical protein
MDKEKIKARDVRLDRERSGPVPPAPTDFRRHSGAAQVSELRRRPRLTAKSTESQDKSLGASSGVWNLDCCGEEDGKEG